MLGIITIGKMQRNRFMMSIGNIYAASFVSLEQSLLRMAHSMAGG